MSNKKLDNFFLRWKITTTTTSQNILPTFISHLHGDARKTHQQNKTEWKKKSKRKKSYFFLWCAATNSNQKN